MKYSHGQQLLVRHSADILELGGRATTGYMDISRTRRGITSWKTPKGVMRVSKRVVQSNPKVDAA